MMNVLIEHATGPSGLKPSTIRHAAEADLKLREQKVEGEADQDARYSFLNRHVHRARGEVINLIALAFIEGVPNTSKETTQRIYYDKSLLRETLIELLIEQRPKEKP